MLREVTFTKSLRNLVLLAAAISMCAEARADLFVFEYTGVLPEGQSWHPEVEGGESWVAQFVIDTAGTDQYPDNPNWGLYQNSVKSGSLTLSGGFHVDFDTSRWSLNIYDNAVVSGSSGSQGGGIYVDGIGIYDSPEGAENFFIQAHVQDFFPDVPVLLNDGIPEYDLTFSSSGSFNNYYQMGYREPGTDRRFGYGAWDEVNVTFRSYAVAVPEPSYAIWAGLVAFGSLFVGRGLNRLKRIHPEDGDSQ